jgi:hypothetical protein
VGGELAGTLSYSPTVQAVVWEGELGPGSSVVPIVFQVEVTGIPTTAMANGHPVTNTATMIDIGELGSLPYQMAERAIRIMPAKSYLPLVMRNYPPRPVGDVVIEDGAATVYQNVVILALTATVSNDIVDEVCFSNDAKSWPVCEDYVDNEEWEWELADSTSGLKTVYVQFKGSKGGVSEPASDQVYLSLNGDFEYGDVQPGWRATENPLPVSIVQRTQDKPSGSTSPADGRYALLLGNPAYPCASNGVPVGYTGVRQTFDLPSNVAKLTFKYLIWSQDASPSSKYDRFEVYVDNELKFADGNQVSKGLSCSNWWRVPGPDNPRGGQTDGWATGEIDLSSYAGQSVSISFRNYSRYDGWYNTYTYVDSVSVEGSW